MTNFTSTSRCRPGNSEAAPYPGNGESHRGPDARRQGVLGPRRVRRGSRYPVTAGWAAGGRRAGRRAGPQTVMVRVSVTGAVAEPFSKETRMVRTCRPGPKIRVSGVVLR